MTRSRIRLALAAVLGSLAFASTAHAAGPQIVSTNSSKALEAQLDGRVTVRSSNTSNLRQHWTVETASNGLVRYRNDALLSCLVTPPGATSTSVNELRMGPCFGIGARNLWSSLSFSSSGRLMKSAQTTQLVAEPLCIDISPCDDLARLAPASFSPALDVILRWRLK
jgi:hypothetical protein